MLPCEVLVTSTVHPLFGQLLEATAFKRRDGVLLLVVVLPDGSPGTIPAEVTNVFDEQVVDSTMTVLSVEGVRRLRVLVDSFGPLRRSRSRPKTRK